MQTFRLLQISLGRLNSLSVLLAVAATLAIAPVAVADHQWNSYHWEKKNTQVVSLTIGDSHIPSLYNNWSNMLGSVVTDWAAYGGSYFTVSKVAKGQGDIESFNDNYGDTGWLGLASISVTRGKNKHIISGQSLINEYYITLSGYTGFDELVEWQHVMCQEIGHTFGMQHNRNGPSGGQPDDSCMNDEQRPLRYPTPNLHDTEQLNLMYEHDHGDSNGGGGKPPKCHPRRGCPTVAQAFWAERYANESAMLKASDLVVEATVLSANFDRAAGRAGREIPITRVILRVANISKGHSRPVVFLEHTRGPELEIMDDPAYIPGERYTLHLRQIGVNTYRIVNPAGRIRR